MPRHGSSSGKTFTPSVDALRQVTAGAYERAIVQQTTLALNGTAGTEVEIGNVGGYIAAFENAGVDQLFSWFRIQAQVYCTLASGEDICFEWMLIRLDESEALPDLNDSATVEKAQKEKRILDRGLYRCMAGTNGKTISIEKYNVKVPKGTAYHLVVRPINESCSAGHAFAIVEWRKVATQG